MFGERIPDKTILSQVNKKLVRAGTQAKIIASVSGGAVTLAGILQYDHQRRALIRVASQVSGVRNVIDQMTVQPKKRII